MTRLNAFRPLALFFGALALQVYLCDANYAQQSIWKNAAGGDFNTPSNWNPGVPNSTDAAIFNLSGNYSVNVSSTATIGSIQVTDGDVIFKGGNQLFASDQSNVLGTATFIGAGTTFDSSNVMRLQGTNATLNVLDGATINNSIGYMGWTGSPTTTTATVSGTNSQWNNSSSLNVGHLSNDNATLNILNGGLVTNTFGHVGNSLSSNGTVNLHSSQWNNSSAAYIGFHGTGTLTAETGSVVTSSSINVGHHATGVGTATIKREGSQWNATGIARIGFLGNGTLNIEEGGTVTNAFAFIGGNAGSVGQVNVTDFGNLGTNSRWTSRSLFLGTPDGVADGGTGSLTVDRFGMVIVGEDTPTTSGNGEFVVGSTTSAGKLYVFNGSTIQNEKNLVLGKSSGFLGTVTVNGTGSLIDNSVSSLTIVGDDGLGVLNIENGGQVDSWLGRVALGSGSFGNVRVTGAGSTWNNESNLLVGGFGTATLKIESGGTVNSATGSMGLFGGNATATITDSGSSWNIAEDLSMRNTTLDIDNDGELNLAGKANILSTSAVNLGGGTFRFGIMSADSYSRVNGTSGTLEGSIEVSGFTDINTLNANYAKAGLNTNKVRVGNIGVIYGSGVATNGVTNMADGEIRTMSGEWSRFGGVGSVNAGQVNNFGGTVEFAGDLVNQAQGEINNFGGTIITSGKLTNQAGGFIAGRGVVIANEGLENAGVIAVSSGNLDVLGDVNNLTGGQVVTSGNATTTFYDDVMHNGAEIRTASGSSTVFLGDFSGAGSFTGTGAVFFEGDLRPGNSPDVVSFGGDVTLGSGADTLIELGGTNWGDFDALLIAGDFNIGGTLAVELINGFNLDFNQQFVIADVGGSAAGQYNGLNEGALVGTYGSQNLYIGYSGGGGNDVFLFTAVPEPSSAAVLGFIGLSCMLRRRRGMTQAIAI